MASNICINTTLVSYLFLILPSYFYLVHRKNQPRNILFRDREIQLTEKKLTSDFTVVISDFGGCRFELGGPRDSKTLATKAFSSPEMLDGQVLVSLFLLISLTNFKI